MDQLLKKALHKTQGVGWSRELRGINEMLMPVISTTLQYIRKQGRIYPNSEDLFNAFKYCDLDTHNVTLIGEHWLKIKNFKL